MALPAGFITEEALTAPANDMVSSVPNGFVPEGNTMLEIRQTPQKGAFNRIIDFFKDPEKQVARSQNIYALSKVTGLPINEVNKNYEILSQSSRITGIQPDISDSDYMKILLFPAIAAGAVANPVGTAAGLLAYGALDKAIPTEKLVKKMNDEGMNDAAVNAVELIDFVGKSLIVGGVFKKAPKVAEGFLKNKITEYKMPEVLTLDAAQVKDIYQTGTLTTPEQQSLFGSLDLNSFDRRAAISHGVSINIPAEKIVRVTDKPYWSKIKGLFGMSAENTVTTMKAGGPTKAPLAPAGLIEGKVEVTPPPAIDPVKKVISALNEAKDLRSEQETIYAKERKVKFAKMMAAGQNVSGEQGYYAKLGALKGEMPKVEFESIRGKIGQGDVDALFNMVRESPKIGEWEKLNASQGLSKLFGEQGGKVPTEGELRLLNEVFGKEFTAAVLEKRSFLEKAGYALNQIANIPRSIMSSFDLSAPMRQGVFLIGRPKQWGPAVKAMFPAFANEKGYEAIQDAIIAHPDYQLARDSNLALTDVDVLLGSREEAFMSSWAEKIPLIGKGVKASERAYIGFLNKLRFDTFTDMVNKAEGIGLDPRKNRDLTRDIADFVNNATGRGTLPKGLQKAAVNLNNIFFSPRLIMSRMNLLNPHYYMKQKPFVRKEALKSLFSFVGFGVGVLTLAKLAGAEVGAEPRSSDFGKIKIGPTRIDVWGGFQPLVRSAAQIITGKYISSTTGKEMTLGEGYKPMTRADIVQRFFEGKLAPIPSFIVTLMKGQDISGEKVSVPKEIMQRFIPMVLQDLYDLAQESPGLLPIGLATFFGVGMQTYKEKNYR